jgi:hypothetical protein
MHNRQTGAAHIPIMFFLILLVMFLGALAFAFIQQQENSEVVKKMRAAKADATEMRNKDLLISHYIADFGKVIGKPGQYAGRDGQAALYNGAVISYPGLMDPADVGELMEKASKDAGISQTSSLETLLGSMIQKINSQAQRVKDIELERDKALADKVQGDQRYVEVERASSEKADETAKNLEQARSDFEAAKGAADRRLGAAQQNVRTKDDEMSSYKEEALVREKALKAEIALLKTQLSALVQRNALRQPPNVADGKVLVARNGIPTAFINLGRKDLLQPGTVFRIKAPNSSNVKGYCEVTRVEDERAEVRLYDFIDPVANYATEGDMLFNDLYTPRVTRTMFLMGRFGAPYGKEQLTNLLRRLGNRVVSKMGPGVDTVVLGNNPVNEANDGFASVEESAEFKMANELRVEFTYLSKIADLVKL